MSTVSELLAGLAAMSAEVKRNPIAVGFACSPVFAMKLRELHRLPADPRALPVSGVRFIVDPRLPRNECQVYYSFPDWYARVKEQDAYDCALAADEVFAVLPVVFRLTHEKLLKESSGKIRMDCHSLMAEAAKRGLSVHLQDDPKTGDWILTINRLSADGKAVADE